MRIYFFCYFQRWVFIFVWCLLKLKHIATWNYIFHIKGLTDAVLALRARACNSFEALQMWLDTDSQYYHCVNGSGHLYIMGSMILLVWKWAIFGKCLHSNSHYHTAGSTIVQVHLQHKNRGPQELDIITDNSQTISSQKFIGSYGKIRTECLIHHRFINPIFEHIKKFQNSIDTHQKTG